jgi:protease-4
MALADKLIDAIGGESEAIDWLESDKKIAADLPVVTRWPRPDAGFGNIGKFLGSQARAALGLPAEGPVALDGLVSLWQVGS